MRKLAQGTRIDILHLHFLTKTYKHSLTLLHSYTKPHYSKLPFFLSTMTFYYSFFLNTMTFIMNMRDYIYIYIYIKGGYSSNGRAWEGLPKERGSIPCIFIFLQKPTSTRSPCLIHTQNHTIQNLPFFMMTFYYSFFFKAQ